MLDRDLAELYGVPTKRLNEQVKRNARRFPPSFMFQLTKGELQDWRSQIATSKGGEVANGSQLVSIVQESNFCRHIVLRLCINWMRREPRKAHLFVL